MNNYPPGFFAGYGGSGDDNYNGNRPSPRKELQGPRPAALKLNKDSHKISKKPPLAPPHNHHHPPRAAVPDDNNNNRQPLIIYDVSPKVIHTTANDFMSLVQRLTGHTPADTGGGAGDMSPAARLASIERTSPKTANAIAEIPSTSNIMDDLLRDMDTGGHRFSSGILSPAPGTLPPISPGFFSPAASDPFMMGFGNMFVPSPSALAAAAAPSPSALFSPSIISPSSTDYLFNTFFDF